MQPTFLKPVSLWRPGVDKPGNKNWVWWDTPRLFTTASVSHQKIGQNRSRISVTCLPMKDTEDSTEKSSKDKPEIKTLQQQGTGLELWSRDKYRTTVKRDFVIWENAETGALKQPGLPRLRSMGPSQLSIPSSPEQSGRFRHDLKMFPVNTNRFLKVNKPTAIYSITQNTNCKPTDYLDQQQVLENFSIINSICTTIILIHVAGYTQLEFRPLYRLKAVAGIRLEQNSLDGINDKLVPVLRAGLNWQAADFTFLRASFGQGYRYPSIAEKHASTTLGSVTIFPNPGILPESGRSLETGGNRDYRLGK